MGVEDEADAVAAVVWKHCSGEVCLAIWAAAAEDGVRAAAGAEADLAAVVASAEVLVEAVTLAAEVRAAAGNTDLAKSDLHGCEAD